MKSEATLVIDFNKSHSDIPFIACDPENIKHMLPKLFPEQQEDVLCIEKRFQDSKGYLITNGTGTGKTYVGLGVIVRFLAQGKDNILIVVPTDAKCGDWIMEGEELGVSIYKLEGIKDPGFGVRVTTYANFYQNEALLNVDFDLIEYDECHYLNQNQQGKETSCLAKHHIVANTPRSARAKATDLLSPAPRYEDPDFSEKKKEWNRRHLDYSTKLIDGTKVLFLSATPFAYHKSLLYGDGTLFEIYENRIEKPPSFNSYNEGDEWGKFLIENFGYRMKTNKVTIPEVGVDQNLLERAFFEKMVKQGIASTRVIDLDVDYSRHFPKIHSELGEKIDKGINEISSPEFSKEYKTLGQFAMKRFTYLYTNQLLECLKAQLIYDRIQAHLYLERKIVIFHTYNHSNLSHPFKFTANNTLFGNDKNYTWSFEKDVHQFEQDFPHLVNLDISRLINARDAIRKSFPDILEFNGLVPKKQRKINRDEFNDPYSGKNIIVVQTKAGREGLSLHDTWGGHQRVMMDLGLPVVPSQAIQEEGRIYRYGSVTNGIYEYPTLQTSFERIAFGQTIAQRAKTVENLAMGNLARDLETAFKEGYANYTEDLPNIFQGRGGKDADRVYFVESEWEKAKTYYFQRQKVNSKRKSGGSDFFATPEPLGYKMVKWLNLSPGEAVLEPSAGVGSISRFFTADLQGVIIEPHYQSASMCEINSSGTVHIQTFESYYVGNKFEGIVMNPPFGTAGKLAMEHLAKAAKHLGMQGGVIYCIVPCGNSMDKRIEAWMEEREFSRNLYEYHGSLRLPACTFERAGTSVMTRIIKIVKRGWKFNDKHKVTARYQFPVRELDLTYCSDINELFDALEDLTF